MFAQREGETPRPLGLAHLTESKMPSDDLEILFHDEHLVAVNKPSGIFVHRSPMSPPTEPNVMRLLRDQIGQLVTPVHRLDRATSGVLLFALTTDAARELSRQFSEHTVSKQYLAIVRGHTSDEATIDIPLKPHRDGLTGKSRRDDEAQAAVTLIRTLDRCEIPHSAGRYPTSRYSLIEALPQTGRRHQIRRHLKHTSHPILGDVAHGDQRHNHLLQSLFGLNRMLLVASRLEFEHPASQAHTTIEASGGPHFKTAAEFLGLTSQNAVTRQSPADPALS